MYKGKGLRTCYSAAYMSRLKTSSALQSWKWQLIGIELMILQCIMSFMWHPLGLEQYWHWGIGYCPIFSSSIGSIGYWAILLLAVIPDTNTAWTPWLFQ